MIKEYIKQWKLLNTQHRYVKQMIKELKEYIKYSKDNDIDKVFEISERMEMINDFSIDL